MELCSLNKIFEKRIIRIPDYQRGYAWTRKQLSDFWDDLVQIQNDKIHYTGVITLDPIYGDLDKNWNEDVELIKNHNYSPFYIVDGQQRLTTAIIFIQAILEAADKKGYNNIGGKSLDFIKEKFIRKKINNGIANSYLFGYLSATSSDAFLKSKIFNEHSEYNRFEENLYTNNLLGSKKFFLSKLDELNIVTIEEIYKKLTERMKFNLYEIDEEIDVFVTFETMNSRGKELTSLELLKNRLIYLSTLFDNEPDREMLRSQINSSWSTVYEYLGKNANKPLDDDTFLRNHWTMYFKYSRKKGDDYIRFLLDEKFHKNNILNPKGKRLTVQELSDYVINLQISIRHWFYIHNPSFPLPGYENEENKKLLNRMNRVGFKHFKPLLLACFVSNQNMESINELLKYAEKYNFTLFSMCRRRANVGDTELFSLAQSILVEEVGMYTVMDRVRSIIDRYYSEDKFYDYIHEKYNVGRNGFYHWDGLNYFLYEYEQYLLENGKQSSSSIDWKELQKKRSDSETIEHVLPQKVGLTDLYWRERFHDRYSEEQIFFMAHSLGNLVPLSRAKNSSVSNASFREKKDNGRGIGYYNGSAAENELNKYEDWTPTSILERGIALLKFMEARWDISLGDNSFKVKLLHMDFLSS